MAANEAGLGLTLETQPPAVAPPHPAQTPYITLCLSFHSALMSCFFHSRNHCGLDISASQPGHY